MEISLSTAAALLGDQARVFIDVYKLYGFRDDQTLSEYVEFFLHEPVAWFEGLPGNLKSKAAFARPKTAFSKLIKHGDVLAALGEEVCDHVHEVLWGTYKKEAERIVAKRGGGKKDVHEKQEGQEHTQEQTQEQTQEHTQEQTQEQNQEPLLEVHEIASDNGSVHSVKKPKRASAAVVAVAAAPTYETKFRIVERALRELLRDGSPASDAMLVFLDALNES